MNAYSEAGDECLRKQPGLTRHTDPNDVGIVISYGKIPTQVEGSFLVLADRGEGLTGWTQSLGAMTHQAATKLSEQLCDHRATLCLPVVGL